MERPKQFKKSRKLNWGKHKHTMLKDVPTSYLHWFVEHYDGLSRNSWIKWIRYELETRLTVKVTTS
jgi:hypothetical protein